VTEGMIFSKFAADLLLYWAASAFVGNDQRSINSKERAF